MTSLGNDAELGMPSTTLPLLSPRLWGYLWEPLTEPARLDPGKGLKGIPRLSTIPTLHKRVNLSRRLVNVWLPSEFRTPFCSGSKKFSLACGAARLHAKGFLPSLGNLRGLDYSQQPSFYFLPYSGAMSGETPRAPAR